MRLLTSAFFLSDTHGLPLALILDHARRSGYAASIPHFYRDALAVGWKPAKALSKIEEALLDAGESREYADAALDWLRTHRELPQEPQPEAEIAVDSILVR